MTTTARRKLIRWSPSEAKSIALRTAHHSHEGLAFHVAISRAQSEIVDKSKWRNWANPTTRPNAAFMTLFREERQRLQLEQYERILAKTTPLALEPEAVKSLPEVQAPPSETQLFLAVLDRIATALEEIATIPQPAPPAQQKPTPPAPRVVVVGFEPKTATQLQRRLHFPIYTYSQERAMAAKPSADLVVLAKFCSHAARKTLETIYGRDKIVFSDNGLSETAKTIKSHLGGSL